MSFVHPFRCASVFALALSAAALCLDFAVPSVVGAAEEAGANAADSTIVVKSFMFTPTSITVKAGTRVTWTNKDEEPHTVASSEGVFRSAALDTDESFSYQFSKPGTYHYTCTIHPRMVGTITVE
jgi:plastocyanin